MPLVARGARESGNGRGSESVGGAGEEAGGVTNTNTPHGDRGGRGSEGQAHAQQGQQTGRGWEVSACPSRATRGGCSCSCPLAAAAVWGPRGLEQSSTRWFPSVGGE
jgi:hypothetical protein